MKQRRHHYSKLDVILASPTLPTPREKRNYQLSHIMQALASINQGSNPDTTDWQLLTDAVNLVETLVQMGEIDDSNGLLSVAVTSMAQAAQRFKRGMGIRLDGCGLDAIKSIVDVYTDALDVIPHRQMVICHRATEKRIWAIVDNKGHAHDVCITSI